MDVALLLRRRLRTTRTTRRLVLGLRLRLVRAVLGRALELAVAPPGAVVGVVEALPLKCTATGWKTRWTGASQRAQLGHRVVGHLLHDLELVAVARSGTRRSAWHSQYRSAKRRLPRLHRTMRRMAADAVTMDKIVALCKRRGLIFPASEIYGGIANTYDYGHYGVLLKRNVIDAWWQAMIRERDDIVALDSAIIQHPQDVGGLRPPRRLHRPARRLPDVRPALPRRPPRPSCRAGASRPSTRARPPSATSPRRASST